MANFQTIHQIAAPTDEQAKKPSWVHSAALETAASYKNWILRGDLNIPSAPSLRPHWNMPDDQTNCPNDRGVCGSVSANNARKNEQISQLCWSSDEKQDAPQNWRRRDYQAGVMPFNPNKGWLLNRDSCNRFNVNIKMMNFKFNEFKISYLVY